MLVKLNYREVKVRRPDSQKYKGEDKFTGSVTYQVFGSLDGERLRMSIGTEEKTVAVRRVAKLERAVAEGPASPLWTELSEALPAKTFNFFADRIGYVQTHKATAKATWKDLCDVFEIEMQRLVDNKERGAAREEGIMAKDTRNRYRGIIRLFSEFLEDTNTPLDSITPAVITKYKVARHKAITSLKQHRGGTGVALEVVVLHRMFAFAVSQKMMAAKPIDLSKESKPGKNPKHGARPFTGEELAKLRSVVKFKQKGQPAIDDTCVFLLLRWLGLRTSDAVRLSWEHIHFDRGVNGEVEVLTQKRGKIAIIPLSTELRIALDELWRERKPRPEDRVLFNPCTKQPFTSRTRLSMHVKSLCRRAGVKGSAHCFRDTFACDMLAKGNGIYEVAQMLADTVETVQKHYAQFVPAARDAAQVKMDTGVGIEEQAQLAQQRGKKIVALPARR